MHHSLWKLWAPGSLLAVVSLLVACGGGGGGGSGDHSASEWFTNPAGASAFNGAAATYQGSISGLGSIVVNGVRFETTDALVYDSDDFSPLYDSNTSLFSSPLALGMTVALLGDVDDTQNLGRAARIRVVGGARGTMLAIDTTALTLTLPTQTIYLDSATTYGGTSDGTSSGVAITRLAQLAALTNNPLLTIYGLPRADGSFLATRVVVTHAQTHAMDVAVRGSITSIAGNSYTVKTDAVQSITVTCNGCTIQPSGSTPAVGDVVRVLATDLSQWSSPTLNASRLQLLNASYVSAFTGAPSAASYAKIKGVATWDGSRWRVAGIEVSGATLNAGTLYEIKGTWSGAVLIASHVEVEGQRSFADNTGSSHTYRNELYGAVSLLNGSSFMVQGVPVNAASAYFPYGSAANMVNGSFVEVKGSFANGTLLASKVVIKSVFGNDAGTGRVFEMYGQVSGWTGLAQPFSLSRMGVVYSAQTSTRTRFKTGLPGNGSYVEVKGYMDADQVFQVIKLELKNGYQDHDD